MTQAAYVGVKRPNVFMRFVANVKKYPLVYLMALPVVAYYLIFHYGAMWGLIIAFKDYVPRKGIFGSKWVGLVNFQDFIAIRSFPQIVFNTLIINFYQLVFSFPAPILLALLLNEIRNNKFKRTVQTISYMPHFVSIMVLCGMVRDFVNSNGLINNIIVALGGERSPLMSNPEYFRLIYIGSGIWQEVGYGSIIFLAALTNIDPELYEAAAIDGAGRLRQTFNITLPGITPTIVIMLILRIGRMMSLGFEKIILLYSPITYEVADVISSFVYRRGLLEMNYSFGASVDLFNSVINFSLLIVANWLSNKYSETGLF